jgi:hypothetical protein
MTIKSLSICLAVLSSVWVAGAGTVSAQSASEDRPVAHFSKLRVGNGIDVYLTQSTEESLRLEVEDFALADVVSEVEGDVLSLSIKPEARRALVRDAEATAHISFVQLSRIEASGGSDVASRNDLEVDALAVDASAGSDVELAVQAKSLEFSVAGGSDVEVSGATQSLNVAASGGSDVDAGDLEAERVTLSVTGGSDASVRATAAIVVDASGGSDVVIHGNPAERTINNDNASDVFWQ